MKCFEILVEHVEAGELLFGVLVYAEDKEQALREYVLEREEYGVANITEYEPREDDEYAA